MIGYTGPISGIAAEYGQDCAAGIEMAIARAMMSQPELLLLDEPSMGLAPMVVRKIIGEVIRAIHESGTTIFLSEQNARMALMISRRGYVLETGRIVLEGSSSELMNNDKVKKAYIGA